jgi:hypothetical protein
VAGFEALGDILFAHLLSKVTLLFPLCINLLPVFVDQVKLFQFQAQVLARDPKVLGFT